MNSGIITNGGIVVCPFKNRLSTAPAWGRSSRLIPEAWTTGRCKGAARHHPVSGPQVFAFCVAHRADDGELVGNPRHARHVLADPHPRNSGVDRPESSSNLQRCLGLHVPHVKLRGSAGEVKDDDRPGKGTRARHSPLQPGTRWPEGAGEGSGRPGRGRRLAEPRDASSHHNRRMPRGKPKLSTAPVSPNHARMSRTTSPSTSVSRKSRPA